jgi:hypothetical protein
MISKRKRDGNRFSRGKFIGFLGKIGLLSLIPGLPASAGTKACPTYICGDQKCEIHSGLKIEGWEIAGPKIRGRVLSQKALDSDLSTDFLGHVRDMVSGRFFGQAGRNLPTDYSTLIDWDPGSEGNHFCGVAIMDSIGENLEFVKNEACFAHTCSGGHSCSDHKCSTFSHDNYAASVDPGCEIHCDSFACESHSGLVVSWEDFNLYPNDAFVLEINDILQTTDINAIKQELTDLMHSPEVIDLSIQRFVRGASQYYRDRIR